MQPEVLQKSTKGIKISVVCSCFISIFLIAQITILAIQIRLVYNIGTWDYITMCRFLQQGDF